jgi:hypothetical protein
MSKLFSNDEMSTGGQSTAQGGTIEKDQTFISMMGGNPSISPLRSRTIR